MSKKAHPVSQVLRLIELLDENERQIVRDFLRPRRGSKVPTKKSTKVKFQAPDPLTIAASGGD